MDETKEIKMDSNSEETLAPIKDSSNAEVMDVTSIDEAPSRSKDLSKTLPEEAFNNFIQGKRHMLVQDFTFAVQSLATACELYVKHFGELAIECGEVYFLYGKSLIRYAQSQSHRGVLGDAINKGEDKEKEGEKNGSATEENKTETDKKESFESTDSPQHVENKVETKEKETEASTVEPDVSMQNESSNEENPEAEDNELELAWNILEAAKSIFLRQGKNNKEAQLKVAEILQLLAETSLETDNYLLAVSDLKSCLSIQEKHLASDDRILAHTYYQLGLAYMLQKMYDGALENFIKTMKLFELRKENLKNTPVSETVGGFEAAEWQKELEEIDGIITDIKEKIEDTKELVCNAKNELQEAIIKKEKEAEIEFRKPSNEVSSSKPVSNITHLLKRKSTLCASSIPPILQSDLSSPVTTTTTAKRVELQGQMIQRQAKRPAILFGINDFSSLPSQQQQQMAWSNMNPLFKPPLPMLNMSMPPMMGYKNLWNSAGSGVCSMTDMQSSLQPSGSYIGNKDIIIYKSEDSESEKANSLNDREIFLLSLKKMVAANYALKFCSLLIEAQDEHELFWGEEEDMCDKKENHSKKMAKIAVLLGKDCHKVIEGLLMIIRANFDDIKNEVQEFLSVVTNLNYSHPCKYTKLILSTTISFISCDVKKKELYDHYFDFEMGMHKSHLSALKCFTKGFVRMVTSNFLLSANELKVKNLTFSQEDCDSVKCLLVEDMSGIIRMIKEHVFHYDSRYHSAKLQSELKSVQNVLVKMFGNAQDINPLIKNLELYEVKLGELLDWGSDFSDDECMEP